MVEFVILGIFVVILWFLEKFFEFFIGVNDHGAEFEEFKRFAVFSNTGLSVNNAVKITGTKIEQANDNIKRN